MIKKTDREDIEDLQQTLQYKGKEACQANEKHPLRKSESSSSRLKKPIKVDKVGKE